jgi:calcium-dependent protein kinase
MECPVNKDSELFTVESERICNTILPGNVTNTCNIDELYIVECKNIGHGGFGKVKKGLHKASGVCCAIKSIPKKSMPNPINVAQEIEIMKFLDHPNIIQLHETLEDAKGIYLVMELCTGGDLLDRIMELDVGSGFSEKVAAKLVKQIASAVAYMHAKSIAHRDLKPENVMLLNHKDVSESTLKVIDFGFSRQFERGACMTSKWMTPKYVAPEVIKGRYTELCDVWSLGVVTYLLLSGSVPFFGHCDADILKRVKKGVYDFDMPVWETVSEDAMHLVSKMLIVDPENRITSEQALHHTWLEKLAPNASEVLPKTDIKEDVCWTAFDALSTTCISS